MRDWRTNDEGRPKWFISWSFVEYVSTANFSRKAQMCTFTLVWFTSSFNACPSVNVLPVCLTLARKTPLKVIRLLKRQYLSTAARDIARSTPHNDFGHSWQNAVRVTTTYVLEKCCERGQLSTDEDGTSVALRMHLCVFTIRCKTLFGEEYCLAATFMRTVSRIVERRR